MGIMYNGKENIVICDHPLIKHKITMLRNKETGTNEFRAIVEEIAMLMGYEALRDLELEEVEIETPIERANCPVIAGKKPEIVPILRAGLGLVGGLCGGYGKSFPFFYAHHFRPGYNFRPSFLHGYF